MKKVTVILPLHNSEKYIRECIDSIINQTLQEIEIICIDSGSDGTSDIINSYAESDKRIQYLYDSNSSYGYKINKGIALSQGTYVAIVESDDYIRSDMLQILFEVAEKSQVDFIKADYKKFIDINGRRIETDVKHLVDQSLYNRVINIQEVPEINNHTGYSIWAGLYRKEFLISNNLYLNETPGASYQDTGFSILVNLLSNKVYYIDCQLYRYRIDNSDSSVKSQNKYRCIIDEFSWIKEQMQLRNINKEKYIYLYNNKKLMSYFWNYQRLSPEYQKKFLEEIHEDVEEFFNNDIFMKSLSPQQIDEVKILHGDERAINKFKQNSLDIQNNIQQTAAIFKTKDEIVIFGAGKYGEVLIELNHILNQNNIVSICDNDTSKHNFKLSNLAVKNPFETVLEHKNAFFVIANKRNGKEILSQLVEYGISHNSIYISEKLAGKTALLEAVLELPE
uniref:glycosyltransferase family 2 protein n=1 Tax=Clostridium sp. 12(A) TaxID=1163671 RepID=UPI0004669192|nr:glycosyltransferase [Clostridium sp. 12(A)]